VRTRTARRYTRKTLDAFGLTDTEVRLVWRDRRSKAWVSDEGVIHLNRWYVWGTPSLTAKETARHEVAHVLTLDEDEAHGPKFWIVAALLGCDSDASARLCRTETEP
jgi:hypothetical protein